MTKCGTASCARSGWLKSTRTVLSLRQRPAHHLSFGTTRSARLLVSAGIRAPQELRALGAVGAFRRVLFHRAGRVSTNLLWALAGALRNERWDRLDAETRAQLLAELNEGSLGVPDSDR